MINENDNEFKYHLDRFKYATRYKNSDEEFHFTNAIKFIKRWNELLAENKYFFGNDPTIADWSIWPFVRQFKIACENQKRLNYLDQILERIISLSIFLLISFLTTSFSQLSVLTPKNILQS